MTNSACLRYKPFGLNSNRRRQLGPAGPDAGSVGPVRVPRMTVRLDDREGRETERADYQRVCFHGHIARICLLVVEQLRDQAVSLLVGA